MPICYQKRMIGIIEATASGAEVGLETCGAPWGERSVRDSKMGELGSASVWGLPGNRVQLSVRDRSRVSSERR